MTDSFIQGLGREDGNGKAKERRRSRVNFGEMFTNPTQQNEFSSWKRSGTT
eukprot:CAMPEP_0197458952 /NCGR_PEP_ID=MMETSP1175-20131217/50042_1 /TAXON_ID=1003142 /ORGANISM="Triceratium dubium, Strain CCMP147" /LENGTH=50 /DNA_ID=CAMNT_0042993701 /DNA_START=86 /DNA_END=234 /DNA_ORIENTATION=+